MYTIKEIYKKIIKIILLFLFINCLDQSKYEVPEPKLFYSMLKENIEKEYFFKEKIQNKDIDRVLKNVFNISEINTLNPEEYLIEILDNIYKKNKENLENSYRLVSFEILKNFKGRNIYLTPSTIERLENKENTAGVGLVLFEESKGKFFILDIIEGSPGYIAAIKPNQYLHKIDNEDVQNFFIEDVTAKIRGKNNTRIKLNIQGKDYEFFRANFSFNPVRKTEWFIDNKIIGYYQIRFLNNGTTDIIKNHILEGKNPHLIVLDLRYLSTGQIEEIYKFVDLFLPSLKIIKFHIKNQESLEITTTPNIFHTGKIIVLVQERSSPISYGIASLLMNNSNVVIIGKKQEKEIYISRNIRLSNEKNYGAFIITNGFVEILNTGSKQGKWNDVNLYYPISPLESKPNYDDPFHQKVIEYLKSL